MSVNVVLLLGHLTRDPELRTTPSGQAVCQFGLGVNRRRRNGDRPEAPVFVEVVAWGPQVETVAIYCTKGRAVFVEGRLQLDRWETEGGERRSRLKVVAHRVTFVGRPPGASTPADDDTAEALPEWVTAPEEG
jgi:single-strand DNA-binding protein